MFLTADDIQQLTGYKLPGCQRRWLAENGYSFDVRADGKPIVSKAHYESRHGEKEHRPSEPNLAALDNWK